MARGTSNEGKAHGAELASGYIALTVKYGSAMSQIGKDVRGLEDQAKVSGARAGESVRKGLADGASHGAKQGRIAAMREWSNAEVEAKTTAEKIGKAIGFAVAQPIAIPFKAIRGALHGIGNTGKEAFDKIGESGKDSMGEVLPMGGLMAAAVGGIAPEAIAATAGIGALVGGFGLLLANGEKWEGISHKLSFSTGLQGEALENMVNLVATIGKEIPDSFENIASIVGEVTKNIHLSGDALKTVSEQVSVLRTHGQEVDVQGLGLATRAMGTKESEVPALLDQLYTANTRTGISMNTLIETLARGGSTFKQFGLDAGQSATLLTQFDAAGVDASKVLPTLNRVFKDTAKAGEAPAQFLKEQTDALKKFIDTGDQVDADSLAIKLFGVRNATPIMAAIENGKLDLSAISSGLAPGGEPDPIRRKGKENEGLGDKAQELYNDLDTLLKPYGKTLITNVGGYFDKVSDFLKKYGPEIVTKVASNFRAVRHALDNVGHAFGNIGHAFENVWHAGENVWHALENVWHAAENFWHACENVWHALENVWHAGENVWHALENVWHAFQNVGEAIGATVVFFGQLPEKVGSFFAGLPDKIGAFFSTAADKVAQFFSSAVDKIVGFFSTLPDKIGNLIGSAFSNIHIPGFAGGGAMSAPGPNGRDSALFWGANNEHVLTSDDVNAMGGHAGVYAFRNALHRSGGGEVGPDVGVAQSFVGTAYSQGARNDCSGMVGRVIEGALHTGGGLPTTKNMGSWLAKLGFKSGAGGPGTIRVGWYDHGGGPNSGHAAMTLSDGENAEAGGANGVFTIGGKAAGADNAEFDNHMFLPVSSMYGEGSGGSGGPFGDASGGIGGSSGGGMPAGATAGVGPNGEQGYFTQDAGKVDKAQDKLNRTQDELKSLEDQRDHSKKALSDDKKHELDDKITAKNHELDEAKKQLAEAQQGDFHKGGGKGEKGGDKDNPLSSLGDIFSKGMTETFLPPGFINPLDTPLAKSGGALLSFFGSLLGGKGLGTSAKGLGGALGFSPSALHPHPATPGNEGEPDLNGGEPGLLPKPGQMPGIQSANLAGFNAPSDGGSGGGNTYNFGANYTGATIGHDPQQHQQAVRNDNNAVKRATANTQRYGFV